MKQMFALATTGISFISDTPASTRRHRQGTVNINELQPISMLCADQRSPYLVANGKINCL